MKGHHAACLGATFLLFYGLLLAIHADPARRITITAPSIARAPATLLIRVTVLPVEDQRLLRVEAGSDQFYRASEFPLEGLGGPVMTWLEWRDVPEGVYHIVATVASQTRIVARERHTCLVVGSP